MNDDTGLCDCMIGYYNDASIVKCKACNYSCYKCDGPTTCSDCGLVYKRQMNIITNQCDCPPKLYDDKANLLCLDCGYTCKTCTNSTACYTCETNSIINRVQNGALCNCK